MEHILRFCDHKVCTMGTLGVRWGEHDWIFTGETTQLIPFAHQILDKDVKEGVEFAVMECTAPCLDMGRCNTFDCDVALFTNLTPDHLLYHSSMEDYWKAKKRLFLDHLKPGGMTVINVDDDYGVKLSKELVSKQVNVTTFSKKDNNATIFLSQIQETPNGTKGKLKVRGEEIEFELGMFGEYNVENLMGVVGGALHFGLPLQKIMAAVPSFSGVKGRLERIKVSEKQDIHVFVDFAHNPDGITKVLLTLRKRFDRIIAMSGFGSRRGYKCLPGMGNALCRFADAVVITSDNNRNENGKKLADIALSEIKEGDHIVREMDRTKAIEMAINMAKKGDCVALLGRGHETTLNTGEKVTKMNDGDEARKILTARYCTK